jgi:hypothetical protein
MICSMGKNYIIAIMFNESFLLVFKFVDIRFFYVLKNVSFTKYQ